MKIHWKNLLLTATSLCGLLLLATACNQGDDPAEAMARDFAARNPAKSAPAGNDQSGGGVQQTASGGDSPLLNNGAAVAGADENPCNPCAAESEDEYAGPKVSITIESIDNGIPEYTGKGKYDIRLEVRSDEVPATPSIWVIKAFDDSGEVVGETKKHFTIPSAYPKTLALSGFYCSNQPTSFQIRRVEGDAMTIEEARAGAGDDSGNSGSIGRGVGGGGGGGGQSRSGGGSSGGGSDDDDDDLLGD